MRLIYNEIFEEIGNSRFFDIEEYDDLGLKLISKRLVIYTDLINEYINRYSSDEYLVHLLKKLKTHANVFGDMSELLELKLLVNEIDSILNKKYGIAMTQF